MSIYRNIGTSLYTLSAAFAAVLLPSCAPRVATAFWKIGTPEDSILPGYTVIHAEGKTRHCYPIETWSDGPLIDTYHQLHHHGVAVESELMAYRIYFDKKQTIDPYCKRTPQLELAQSYWYPNDSLLAAGYGDDILRVSGTVGVGSVKYWNGKKMVHFENVAERSQRIVRQSRNSATIEVAVKDWKPSDLQTNGQSPSNLQTGEAKHGFDLTVQYTMQAGHRDMRCDVYTNEPIAGLCTGVQTIPAKGGWPKDTIMLSDGTVGLANNSQLSIINCQLPNGVLLASWGTDWPVNDSAKYAKETVGLAVFVPKEYVGELAHDKQNNLCLLNLTGKAGRTAKRSEMTTCHFYLTCCGATKENHPVASSATEWFAYLRKWAKSLK